MTSSFLCSGKTLFIPKKRQKVLLRKGVVLSARPLAVGLSVHRWHRGFRQYRPPSLNTVSLTLSWLTSFPWLTLEALPTKFLNGIYGLEIYPTSQRLTSVAHVTTFHWSNLL